MYPDPPGNNGIVPATEEFLGSKFVLMSHTAAFYNDLWRRGITMRPPVLPRTLPPFSSDGSKPVYLVSNQIIGMTALRKAPQNRIQELLGIMNWLAAPFGTQEDRLVYYGVQGSDYTPDDKGNPVPTDQGTRDASYVPWRYVAQRPWVWV